MARDALRVEGYREFMRALNRADKEVKGYVRAALKDVGEAVRFEAALRFSVIDVRSAAGYKVSVSQRGVSVYQSLPKTTGLRGDYGALQMRKALVPAAAANREKTEQKLEDALDRVADHFNGGP
jgi:hypothetical protein